MTGALTAVAGALTDADRTAIELGAARANPHLGGATAADLLEMLDQHDAYLDQMEPFFTAHRDLASQPGATYAAYALIELRRPLTRTAVLVLLIRADLDPPVGPADLASFAAQLAAAEAEADVIAGYAAAASGESLADDFYLLAGDMHNVASWVRAAVTRREEAGRG